jgi:hypothetical protein
MEGEAHSPRQRDAEALRWETGYKASMRRIVEILMKTRGEFPVNVDGIYRYGLDIAGCPVHGAERISELVARMDAVIQFAGAKLEPIVEVDEEPNVYGFRNETEVSCRAVWE